MIEGYYAKRIDNAKNSRRAFRYRIPGYNLISGRDIANYNFRRQQGRREWEHSIGLY